MDIEPPIVLTGPTTMLKRQRHTATRILSRGGHVVRNATLLLLVGAGALVGCHQGRGDRCQQDSDCGSGLVCGPSCSLTTSSCTCEPIAGVGSGGTTVVATGGTSGTGGAGGTPDQGQGGGGAAGGATGGGGGGGGGGGASGDSGGAAGEAAGGQAGGSAGGGAGGVAAGGAGGA